MVCPNCGNETAQNAQFCTQCGTKFSPIKKRSCLHCGAELEGNAIFCGMCGMRIEEQPFGGDNAAPVDTNVEISQLVASQSNYDTSDQVEGDDLSWLIEADEGFQRSLTGIVDDEDDVDSKNRKNAESSSGNISLIGIIGAISILIGEFLPIISIPAFVTTFDISFYEIIGTTHNSLIICLAVLVPIAMIVLYFLKIWEVLAVSVWISFFSFYAIEYMVFMESYTLDLNLYIGIENFFELCGVGFWIILLGFVLSLLAPFLGGVNNKLLALIRRN